MTAQVLFFDVFSEEDPHLNSVEFDLKVNVILNGLEKYMSFVINENLVFVDSM